MKDKIYLVIQSGFLYALAILVGLGFSIACARLMPADTYGELRYVMTWLPILMAFSLPGYDTVILRNTNFRIYTPLLRVFAMRFLGACVGALFIFMVLYGWPGLFNPAQKFFFLCVAIALPFFETGTGYKNYLIATHLKKQGLSLGIQTRVATFVLLVLSFFLIYANKYDPIYFLPAYLIAMIGPTLFTFINVAIKQKQPTTEQKPSIFFRQAISLTAAGMIGTVTYSLDKLFVRHELGAQNLAYYAILTMVPLELAKMIDSIIPLFYRRLFLYQQKISPTILVCIGGCFITGIGCYTALFYALSPFVFGPFYRYSLILTFISALLTISMAVEYYCTHHIIARRKPHHIFTFSCFNLFVSATFFALAIHFGNITWLISAMIVKQILLSPLFIWLTKAHKHELSP